MGRKLRRPGRANGQTPQDARYRVRLPLGSLNRGAEVWRKGGPSETSFADQSQRSRQILTLSPESSRCEAPPRQGAVGLSSRIEGSAREIAGPRNHSAEQAFGGSEAGIPEAGILSMPG